MRRLLAVTLAASLAGCDIPPDKLARLTTALCKIDGIAQPVALTIAGGAIAAAPAVAQTVVAVDVSLVHPAIVKACQDKGGTVAGVATGVPAAVK